MSVDRAKEQLELAEGRWQSAIREHWMDRSCIQRKNQELFLTRSRCS
jgi:hypothetical protein